MTKNTFVYKIYMLFILSKFVYSVPADICFDRFDGRDCHQPPKHVFHYYKEGSRCEIRTWRGCPTLNIFRDEFACSHACIGKLWDGADINSKEIDTCSARLNTEDCGHRPQEVYTFKGGICVTEEWYGCDTQNKFDNENSCIQTCVHTVKEWIEELTSLDVPEILNIDNILDDVIEDERLLLNMKEHGSEYVEATSDSEEEIEDNKEGEGEQRKEEEGEQQKEEEGEQQKEKEGEQQKEEGGEPQKDDEGEQQKEEEGKQQKEDGGEQQKEEEGEQQKEEEGDQQNEKEGESHTEKEASGNHTEEEVEWKTNPPVAEESFEEVVNRKRN